MVGWVALGTLVTVAALGVAMWQLTTSRVRAGLWRPIRLGESRGFVPLIGGKAALAAPIAGHFANVRAIRVWMHNRSGVPQEVHVVTGRKWDTTRFVSPWIKRGQLMPRIIHLEPNEGGVVQLRTVAIPEWPAQESDPRRLPNCWLWLVTETASGHKSRRLIRTRLIGDQCRVLW